MYISWSILSLIIYDDRILIPCRICRRVRSTARTETMLSVSRAPHCDTHPAQGARLTLSEGAGCHADPRLRRLRALLPRATPKVRPQRGFLRYAPPPRPTPRLIYPQNRPPSRPITPRSNPATHLRARAHSPATPAALIQRRYRGFGRPIRGVVSVFAVLAGFSWRFGADCLFL